MPSLKRLQQRIVDRLRGRPAPSPDTRRMERGLEIYESHFAALLRSREDQLQSLIREMHELTQENRQQYFSGARGPSVVRAVNKVFPDAYGEKSLDVLDLGCGYGEHLAIFKQLGHRAVGTIYGETIDDFLTIHRLLGVDVVLHDVTRTQLPFPDDQFDVVWCSSVITLSALAPYVAEIVQEMDRVARPGGRVMIRTHVEKLPGRGLKSPADLMPAGNKLLFSDWKDVVWRTPEAGPGTAR